MTPTQSRMVLGLGLALVAGVGVNATVLQSDPKATAQTRQTLERAEAERRRRLALDVATDTAVPAPKLRDGGQRVVDAEFQRLPTREETAVRFARLKTDSARPETLPHAPDAEGPAETVRAVQRELSARNYGPLAANGIPGQPTRAAIMAFEHDNRLALTGEATEALLKRILLGGSGDRSAESGRDHGRVRSVHAEQMIRTIQQSLATLNYPPGRVDGRVGDETERAIREFEIDQGLVPTGRISAELFARIARAVSAPRPQALR